MLKYTTDVLFLHLAPWITTLEKEETIPHRTEEHIYYKNIAFLLYKHSINWQARPVWHTDCPDWHTGHRTTWPDPHRCSLSRVLPPPLPSCSLPCLPEVRACSPVARAQSHAFYTENMALGSPSVPADEHPPFLQSHSALAVSQGSLESPELRKMQNIAIHKAKLSNNNSVLDILLLPLTGILISSSRTGGIVSSSPG